MQTKKQLYIQIPCVDEEETIGLVIKNIPRRKLELLGLSINVLVIDDGSKDKTFEKAKQAGADFILRHKRTLGLAKSFKEGLDYCLEKGADIIVNTDGDNQYDQKEIVKLVEPILDEGADMVIGDRQVEKLSFMSKSKKIGNLIGSMMLRFLTGSNIPDASSGFRSFSASLASSFNLQSNYTYTHETIIQAASMEALILSVPITFKQRISGDSRLIMNGVYAHIKQSGASIVRTILFYRAFKYLLVTGFILITVGTIAGIRFLYFFVGGDGRGHLQSLILASILINLGFMTVILGIIADLISFNRKTLEDIKSKLK